MHKLIYAMEHVWELFCSTLYFFLNMLHINWQQIWVSCTFRAQRSKHYAQKNAPHTQQTASATFCYRIVNCLQARTIIIFSLQKTNNYQQSCVPVFGFFPRFLPPAVDCWCIFNSKNTKFDRGFSPVIDFPLAQSTFPLSCAMLYFASRFDFFFVFDVTMYLCYTCVI